MRTKGQTRDTNTAAALAASATSSDPGTPPKTVGIHTFGCRLNQFESDGIISRFLEGRDYELSDVAGGPDIAIINTCTVTDQAEARSRALVRKILRNNPQSKIVVTGCYAQTDPDKVAAIPGVYAVVGNDQKTGLRSLVEELENQAPVARAQQIPGASEDSAANAKAPIFSGGGLDRAKGQTKRPVIENPFAYGDVIPVGHSRAYLKIQDGCDRRCSYCKIPRARGGGVSRSYAEILDHVKRLDDRGIPEIVITGVNPGWYRDQGIGFNDLIGSILDRLTYSRLRLSSIEPCDVDQELAELSLHPAFCNYFHVPLQSGSREILKLMRRTYSAESYRKRMETVRKINPDVFMGTDVITGFPGETESHFQETLDLMADLGIVQVHAFPYSPREGTDALNLPNPVDRGVSKERVRRLQEFSANQWNRYLGRVVGQRRIAVVEKLDQAAGTGNALSEDYVRIEFDLALVPDEALKQTAIPGDSGLQGQLCEFQIQQVSGNKTVTGELRAVLPEGISSIL
ncbi:MAG: tRNA (N(6)-L-threonylcarbamoyladenosine(37)-C(2))-methylthiotransferase MtaB [Spirochaetaceae bacterium]|nr:tRNA (N(6)-L-threonylcarbamoyladenosine(37)-C(2))-methylthiotransferase MtaB [Spirochaetaceae bacterium]|tara:strand:- start:72432 stop:73976 length:1545 start_codon:yes stop_codon:yes gene_type:complete